MDVEGSDRDLIRGIVRYIHRGAEENRKKFKIVDGQPRLERRTSRIQVRSITAWSNVPSFISTESLVLSGMYHFTGDRPKCSTWGFSAMLKKWNRNACWTKTCCSYTNVLAYTNCTLRPICQAMKVVLCIVWGGLPDFKLDNLTRCRLSPVTDVLFTCALWTFQKDYN